MEQKGANKSLHLFFLIFFCFVLDNFRPAVAILSSPISTNAPNFGNQTHPTLPTSLWGNLNGPHPTNSFWTNLILGDGTNRIAIPPYQIKVTSAKNGFAICYPKMTVRDTSILTGFTQDLSLETAETSSKRVISTYDSLSVTMQWDNGGLTIPLVQGNPYVTGVYKQKTPVLNSAHSITSVNGKNSGTVSGTKFVLTMNNNQIWVVFTSSQITFQISSNKLTASAGFTGAVRVAFSSGDSMTDILSDYSQVYPTGADISYQISNNVASISFAYKTSDPSNSKLLMAAMPHQVDSLTSSNSVILSNAYTGINGPLSLVQGNVLILNEPLPTITWDAPSSIDPSKKNAILQALNEDKDMGMPASDPYFFGKQVARNGRLALIADQLNQPEIASSIRDKMKTELNKWLNSQNSDKLVYDTTWGGICSSRGLANSAADFGNGVYNDHHFHYGYHIYAAAVIAKSDSAWATAYASKVNDLVRDIANPTTDDPFFPVTRHKDWYAGHSWASGITSFGDSKNQESTSEAINGYYGVYLWGLATQNQAITDLGRVMLATEIHSTNKYWHMTTSSSMVPTPFSNNKVVGILWSTKLDYATWFGSNVEYIHCIQMMPFTPITEDYLPASWITEEYPVLSTAFTRTNPVLSEAWKGYVYMAHAIIDPQTAWTEVNRLTNYDNGNTKTNTLYWVATRPTGTNPNDGNSNNNGNQDLC